MLANISIRWLAKVILATAGHFNQALLLWSAFDLCVTACLLDCIDVCLQFAIKKAGEEEVPIKKGTQPKANHNQSTQRITDRMLPKKFFTCASLFQQ